MASSDDNTPRELVPSRRSGYTRQKVQNDTREPRSSKIPDFLSDDYDALPKGQKVQNGTYEPQWDKLPEYLSEDYDPLPRRRGAIRLLKLYFNAWKGSPIECRLITPKENSTSKGQSTAKEQTSDNSEKESLRIPYEALSWCWGTAPKTSCIIVRKGQTPYVKYVTPTLVSALRALRRTSKNRYLWIDAICIDQDDLDEKNHQVEMMNEIYSKAERVCIWLGDATTSSQIALRFIKEEVLQLQNFDDLCKSPESSEKWHALLELMQRPWFSRRWVVQEVALGRRAMIFCGTDKISWNKFAVAVELFVEVETATHRLSEVMKKDPKYYHVPGLFEYISALGASLLVDATGRLFRDLKEERRSDNSAPEGGYGTDSDSDSEVRAEPDVTPGGDMKSPTSSKTTSVYKQSRGQPLLGLEYLVSSLLVFDTTEPHDTIYALLAIAKDTSPVATSADNQQPSDHVGEREKDHVQDMFERFMQRKRYKVDYKSPYVDVCKGFIQFCIDRSLQIDPTRALDVICRPWATAEKVLAKRRRDAEDEKRRKEREERAREERRRKRWPKEMKNAATKRLTNAYTQKNKKLTNGEPHGEGTSGEKSKIKESRTSREENDTTKSKDMPLPSWIPQLSGASYAMYPQAGIDGIKMSRINADPLVGLPRTTQKNYTAAETKNIDMKTLRFRKRAELGHFSMYVKGFVLDTIDEVEQLSRNGQIPQEWTELGGWPDAKGDPPDAFWRTLVADRGRDEKNPPVYYSRACMESFAKGGLAGGAVNTTDLINHERNSVVAQFCRRVQAVTWNRALVKTKRGRLGLVGKGVKQSDLVCILYGCSVPVILRCSDRKKEDQLEREMDWEVKFLVETLLKYCRQVLERMRKHKQRKDTAKKEFYKWELEKWREWLKDDEWRKNWKQKLIEEKAKEAREGLEIKRQYDITELSNLPREQPEAYWRNFKLLIGNTDLRLGREFNAWKREKGDIAKREGTEWKPEVFNWRKFELRLKYFRIWRKNVMAIRKEMVEERKRNKKRRDVNASGSTVNSLPPASTSSESGYGVGCSCMRRSRLSLAPAPTETKWQVCPSAVLGIKEHFRRGIRDDGYYHYRLLGECYVHGMMDGEAMARQNEEEIPTKVFELR